MEDLKQSYTTLILLEVKMTKEEYKDWVIHNV
jgi:hypothetical protein